MRRKEGAASLEGEAEEEALRTGPGKGNLSPVHLAALALLTIAPLVLIIAKAPWSPVGAALRSAVSLHAGPAS